MADTAEVFERIAARTKIDDEENDAFLIGDEYWNQVVFDLDEYRQDVSGFPACLGRPGGPTGD